MANEPEPVVVPGLIADQEELVRSIAEGVQQLTEDERAQFLVDLVEATAQGRTERVRELSLALLFTVRLAQNDEYRRAAKQVERIDEEQHPEPVDRQSLFARLRAG